MKKLLLHSTFSLVIITNMFSLMRFSNDDFFYLLKFGAFVFHIVLLLLLILNNKFYVSKATKKITVVFYFWMLAMVIGLLNSIIFSDFISIMLTTISYFLLFFYSFFILPNFLRLEGISFYSLIKNVFYSISGVMLFSVIISIGDPLAYHLDPTSLRNRYYAFFDHPNFLGLYSTLGIIVTILMFSLCKMKLSLVTIPFYLYLIILSGSRTALIMSFIFILFVMFMNVSTKLLRFIFINPIAIFFLFAISIILITMVNSESFIDTLDKLLSNRITIWTDLIASNKSSLMHFLFGQGNLNSEVSRDNYYVSVLIDNGMIGLGAFLIMITLVIRTLLMNKKIDKVHMYAAILMFIVMLYSFSESIFYTLGNVFSLFLWVLVGYILNIKTFEKPIRN
ncbi:hypothetical protein [Paenibacillus sp. Marseille-Q4541]|uniref:O-antigen ligase family protein n=1 Tax=Paenibacillus sp. Marseille-Q4541 TaxID=2831522 RepID=UPI001BA97AE0|nr:hypothetical protein [Paenibacillus sp. Marseille-Q4541]